MSPAKLLLRGSGLLVALQFGGCIASNVLEAADRVVVSEGGQLEWQPVPVEAIPGLYESVEIRGDAAGALWKIYYLFEAEGRYTAAALVSSDSGLRFQVIDGAWRLDPGGMILDDAEPTPLDGADGQIRMSAAGGTVILRRSEVR